MGTAIARFSGNLLGVEWTRQEALDPQTGYLVATESKDGRLTITLTAVNAPSAADLRESFAGRAETLFQAILAALPKHIVAASPPQCDVLDFIPDRLGNSPVNHTVELSARVANSVTLTASLPESEAEVLNKTVVGIVANDARAEYARAAQANDPTAQFDGFYGLLTKLAKAMGAKDDGTYGAVDVHIRSLDPSIATTEDPRPEKKKAGRREMVHTRLRNEIHHPENRLRVRAMGELAREIRQVLPDLRALAARSLP